ATLGGRAARDAELGAVVVGDGAGGAAGAADGHATAVGMMRTEHGGAGLVVLHRVVRRGLYMDRMAGLARQEGHHLAGHSRVVTVARLGRTVPAVHCHRGVRVHLAVPPRRSSDLATLGGRAARDAELGAVVVGDGAGGAAGAADGHATAIG